MSSIRERYRRNSSKIEELLAFSLITFIASLIWTVTPAPGQFFSILAMIPTGLILLVFGVSMLFAGTGNSVTNYLAMVFASPWVLLVKGKNRVNGRYLDADDIFLGTFVAIIVLLFAGIIGGLLTGHVVDGEKYLGAGPLFFFWGIGALTLANWLVAYLVRIGGIVRDLTSETREAVSDLSQKFSDSE